MSKKIVIGITDCGLKYPKYEKWISNDPDVKVIRLDAKNLDETDKCDGILFTGGEDVHPKFYGSSKVDYVNHPRQFADERDKFEAEIFERAQKKSLAILGICRGLQLANCLLGGTLKQDLEEKNDTHKRDKKTDPDKVHSIKIEQDTLLSTIVKEKTGIVNSSHHQAIDKLGKGLKINATADDGTIEGIELSKEDQSFLLAVQWHPERLDEIQLPDEQTKRKSEEQLSKSIRDRFLEAAKQVRRA